MKTNIYLLFTLFLFLFTSSYAQFDHPDIEDYGAAHEVNLGYPNTNEGVQLIPLGIDLWDGDDVNTIYYGQTPPDSENKPVMVFVHGYAANAGVWFKGNDNMYWDVYRDGYRSVFVSLTPNRHMWTNGNMLANMLDKIIAHYGNSEIVLVGWSKGSVDIDAALVHSNANTKVSEVFTLSAPHFGTGIAELANSVLLSLVNIIFMQNNDATVCLKRGYMNYFRSLTDQHVNNTVPYTTLGAWGNGPLNRLSIPQGYLYLAGGSKASGGNDGVVPYSSSRRPGGTELFSGQKKKYLLGFIPYYTGPDETNLDHYEITRGSKAWPHIKANLSSTYSTQSTPYSYNPNALVTSNMQIVTGSAGKTPFYVEENSGNVTVLIAGKMQAPIIRNQNGEVLKTRMLTSERLANDILKSTLEIENPAKGKYMIESDDSFAALVMTEGGIEANLNTGLSDSKLVYQSGETIRLSLSLTSENEPNLEGALATGTMTRTIDLKLNRTEDVPKIISFKKEGDEFIAQINEDLPSGIYDIAVNIQGKSFAKNVLTSIAVVGSARQQITEPLALSIGNVYPNPANNKLKIQVEIKDSNSELAVYNMFGQKVKTFDLSGSKGKVELNWNISNDIKPGLYILQLSNDNSKITRKIMVK